MTGQELLEKLLVSYQSAFDITRPYDVNGDTYDAYAAFNVTSAKYVLVKKAELWRADCYEHTFFSCRDTMCAQDLDRFKEEIVNYIEPELVREGKDCMEKDHMYTYITGIFLCEQGVSEELKQEIRRFKYFKNYRLGIRGYVQARLLVFDMKNQKVIGNRAARELIKGYKKVF